MKIGLNMIVKNEAHVIKRCLDSLRVENLIDYYHIIDTGSTDGTQEIIKEYFKEKNIDGQIEKYLFTDFSDCRNRALNGIKDKVDYVFWIDADEELRYDADFSFKDLKSDLALGIYGFMHIRCVSN